MIDDLRGMLGGPPAAGAWVRGSSLVTRSPQGDPWESEIAALRSRRPGRIRVLWDSIRVHRRSSAVDGSSSRPSGTSWFQVPQGQWAEPTLPLSQCTLVPYKVVGPFVSVSSGSLWLRNWNSRSGGSVDTRGIVRSREIERRLESAWIVPPEEVLWNLGRACSGLIGVSGLEFQVAGGEGGASSPAACDTALDLSRLPGCFVASRRRGGVLPGDGFADTMFVAPDG